MASFEKEKNEWRRIFAFSHRYLKKQRRRFAGILALLIAGSIISSVLPYFWGKMIDEMAIGNVLGVMAWLGWYFLVTFLTLGMSYLEGYWGSKLNYHVEAEIKQVLLKKALYLSCKELDTFDTGELTSRVISDGGEVMSFVFNVLTSSITIVVNIAAALFFSFRISVPLSLISIAFIPLSIFSNLMFKRSFKALSKLQKRYGDKVSSFYFGTLGHIPEIKSYGLEKAHAGRYQSILQEGWGLQKKQLFLGNKTSAVSSLIATASMASTLGVSALLIAKGTFTLGSMSSFQRYIDKLTSAVSTLLQMNYSAQSAIVAVDRMTDLLSLEDEIEENAAPCLPQVVTSVEFRNVSFRYQEGCEILRGASFRIASPGIYALVGENGSGKTTILKLLMRFYSADEGQIWINGIQADTLPLEALRKSIGYYSKNVYIQDGSLRANLLIGAGGEAAQAETAMLEALCEQVGLLPLIQELPEGLDTKVGENGKLLSSGQKQKIAMVRALLDPASILLMDEMTSDLDGEAERRVLTALQELARTKIILFVTHRILVTLSARETMVLENGEITASGTSQTLLSTSEKYQELFHKQQTGSDAQSGDCRTNTPTAIR